MIDMLLSDIKKNLEEVSITQDAKFQGISKDTRTLMPGNLYVAIKGAQFDGHAFLKEAQDKQASAALVEHAVPDCSLPQIIVKDSIIALGKIAELWRNKFILPLIGVTGSNGKTTLKNMIASILRSACNHPDWVLATEGNLNNNIGVPLMLSQLNSKHHFGVLEMGMNHFGELTYLTRLVKPKIAVINNAASAHLEHLGDVSGVAKSKGEIFLGLDKNGTAILNKDDAFYSYWYPLVEHNPKISFGLKDNHADVTASILSPEMITIHTPKGNIDVKLPLLGRHNVMNALAATACSLALDITLSAIKNGLENMDPAPGRLCQHLLSDNNKIIDDTYNANPASVSAAINTLAALGGTKILVLGDMKELGDNAKQLHFEIGEKAKEAGIHYLFTCGELSRFAAQAFEKNALHFTNHDELLSNLKEYVTQDITILVKGSRSMRMEKIVNGLLPHNHPKKTAPLH